MERRSLANSQLAIMELLWDHGGLTARQIREALYPDAARAQHGTVQRLLQRLEDGGFVGRDRAGAAHVFSPTLSREAYAGEQLESLTEKLTGGSLAPLITHLLAENKLSRSEITRLRGLLDADVGRGESS
jgi:BlaI family transcriptional regulator, penicillinase repressor